MWTETQLSTCCKEREPHLTSDEEMWGLWTVPADDQRPPQDREGRLGKRGAGGRGEVHTQLLHQVTESRHRNRAWQEETRVGGKWSQKREGDRLKGISAVRD